MANISSGTREGPTTFRLLPGLPSYGPMAISFPASFAHTGREGYVVEFLPDTSEAWVGNFAPGLGGYSGVHLHPNGLGIVVFASGSGYVIAMRKRQLTEELPGAIADVWELTDPRGLVCDRQGLAFFFFGLEGLIWHTRRLSWDGFKDITLAGKRIRGLANALRDVWVPFEVDLVTGSTNGGAVMHEIDRDWEKLAPK